MSENKNTATEVAKSLAKDVYSDVGHEIMQPTGIVLGLVPRAIRAALQSVEQWVLQREYNIERTKRLLEEKLKNEDPNNISPPEPYVAVPALQAISYCMDNEELRDLYANLLAKSMTDTVKNGVHPGFVEIIKQLCPDEAKILKQLQQQKETIPTIGVRIENDKHAGIDILHMFSVIGETANCETPELIEQYLCNLIRLGLLKQADFGAKLTNKELYIDCIEHPFIKEIEKKFANCNREYPNIRIVEGFVYLTDYGRAFCKICIEE